MKAFITTRIFKDIRSFFYLILIQSLTAMFWLLIIPKEPEHAVFLGYSLKRLALLIPIILLPILGFVVLALLKRHSGLQVLILDRKKSVKTGKIMIYVGFIVVSAVWLFAFFFHFLRIFPDIGAYIRLLPVLSRFFFLCN